MSANSYTTTDLLDLIQLLGHVPQSNATFTPSKLLTLSDFELRTGLAKQLKEANEGYFQTFIEYPQNSTGIYDIPGDAMVSSMFAVQIRNGQAIWPLSRQEVSEQTTTTFPSVGNWSFLVQGNKLQVFPAQFGGVLKITYERRPSKLVLPTACAQVVSVSGQDITVSSVPSGWQVGDLLDLQQSQPQFDLLGGVVISNIAGTVITVTGDISLLSNGDFLCQSGQTCVPQIPVEFQQLLAQRVVCKIYELQGYTEKLNTAEKKLKEMEADLTAMITPRTGSSPKVIVASWGGRRPGNSWSRFMPPASRNN